jgi:micrococcal nuclease
VVLAAAVVALIVVVILRTSDGGPGESGDGVLPTETVVTASTQAPAAGVASGGVEVSLAQVIDGDTIRVRMPDGSEEKVRYIGIDAPEVAHGDSPGEYLGDEATSHNAQLLEAGPIRLATDVEERDAYERLLAYVWAGDVFVNERMVFDGYAWAHDYPPNVTRQEQLWVAHDRARAAGVGVWADGSRR